MTPTIERPSPAGADTRATTVVAIVVYRGVHADECHAVRSVLERLDGARVVTVGAYVGDVPGPGGVQRVEATYTDVPRPDIVVVPGGLGCREVAEDLELRWWLRSAAPTCRWIVGISTGTVALAASGIARDHPAVTHWLAGGLLEEFGGSHADGRVLFDGRIVTCAGASAARDAVYGIVEEEAGPVAAERIRASIAAAGPVTTRPGSRARRLVVGLLTGRRARGLTTR